MAGDQAKDDKLPKTYEDDPEGESTIATGSPLFEQVLAGNIPLPISAPPPPMTPPTPAAAPVGMGLMAARPQPGLQQPTSPLAFPPVKDPPAPAVRAPSPSSPSVQTPFGGLVPQAPPSPASPAMPAPLPAAGAPAPSPGVAGAHRAPKGRPQTVIGLAPPPAVASPRPGQNLARTAALPDKASARAAIAKTVPDDPAPAWPDDSSESNKAGAGGQAQAKPAPAPFGGLGAKGIASPKKEESAKSDDFGLDAGVADAARAAQAKPIGGAQGGGAGLSGPTPRTPLASPMASPGFGRGALPRPAGSAPAVNAPPPKPSPSPYGLPLGTDDAETSTLSREELEAARRQAAAAAPRQFASEQDVEDEDDESTRAVPREGLVRAGSSSSEDHIVVGDSDDVVGDDATLAVGPQNNAAAALGNPAALAQTMAADDSAPWNQGQPNQGWPQQQGGYPQSQPQPAMPGQPSFSAWGQEPMQQQPQGSWMPNQPGFSQHGQSMPNAPQSNPHMMGMPPSGHMSVVPNVPGSHMPMQPMQMQQGYGAQPMQQQPQGQMPWAQHDAGGGRRVRLSGQILLLAIVGVICLAIFITGIVLFATTKF